MNYNISSELSEMYKNHLKMWSIEHLHLTPKETKPMNVNEAFIYTFDKYDFTKHKGEMFNHEVDSMRCIPWLHKYLKYVFDDKVDINDQLDVSVKVIHKRNDEKELGYIQYIRVSSFPDSDDEDETIDSYYFDYRYDSNEDSDFKPLVIIDFNEMMKNNLLVNYDQNTQEYELSCFRNKYVPSTISYHYWGEF